MMDINELAQRIHKWSVEKGWWPKPTAQLRRNVAALQVMMNQEVAPSNTAIDDRLHGIVAELDVLDVELRRLKFFEKLALMTTEITEALEEVRNGRGYREVYSSNASVREATSLATRKPEGVPIELADLLIRLLDTCAEYGIDLEAAVNAKLIYNDSRPFRHGNKTA